MALWGEPEVIMVEQRGMSPTWHGYISSWLLLTDLCVKASYLHFGDLSHIRSPCSCSGVSMDAWDPTIHIVINRCKCKLIVEGTRRQEYEVKAIESDVPGWIGTEQLEVGDYLRWEITWVRRFVSCDKHVAVCITRGFALITLTYTMLSTL